MLPELGVRLEDRTNATCVKLVDRETLMREQEMKKAAEAAKQAVSFVVCLLFDICEQVDKFQCENVNRFQSIVFEPHQFLSNFQ